VLILNLYVRKRFVIGKGFSVYAFNNSMKDTRCITQFCDTKWTEFDVHVTVHSDKALIIKPTRCTSLTFM